MIKTVNLTANTVIAVEKLGGANARIVNRTAAPLYAGKTDSIAKGGDNVLAIPSGRGDYLEGTKGTVYLLSEAGGEVQLEGTDSFRPFDNAAEEKGGAVTGNPAVMDGLQGGVPFSEIVVSGKNLIPYPYNRTSGVYNGLTVDISDDGKFSVNGTATADTTIFEFAKQSNPIYLSGGVSYTLNCSQQYNIDSFNIFFKIYHADRTYSGYTKYPASFTAKNGDYLVGSLWIKSGSVINAENVEIQLELGDTATAYEPPITGRELTLNINGTEIAVTPDSNPYTVPDDIRQQDGTNVLSVTGAGNPQLTVSYSKTDPALSRIYKTIDSLATAIVAMGAEN